MAMECVGILQLHEVLPHIGEGGVYAYKHDNTLIGLRTGSLRMRTFADKGVDCVVCGCKGAFFSVERTVRVNKITHDAEVAGIWHLNLYGRNKNGNIVLMTHDHIWPTSLGGYDTIKNTCTMCSNCNNKKGNKPPTREFQDKYGGAYDPNYVRNTVHKPKKLVVQPKKVRTPEELALKASRRAAWQANPVYTGAIPTQR